MARVQFTHHLRMHFPDLAEREVAGGSLAEILRCLDSDVPGLSAYLVDDQGSLRPHVNIFINDELLRDRARLSDRVADGDRVFVMQALSGG
jgi:molybdopterin converting factor small subunit